MICGLLGEKLSHSYSPQIHAMLATYQYKLFEKAPQQLELFLKSGEFSGLNVTIPYKKAVIPYCDTLSDTAAMLGAVNTLVRSKDGRLIGHNSDYFGFSSMLVRSGLKVSGKKVLVLGSGGASNTAVCVLRQAGADVTVISRSGQDNYSNLEKHVDAAVIVNTTPVGMYPNTGVSPVDLGLFSALEGVLDVIYNPSRTALLLDAERRGLVTENGLWMLVAQAKESAEWFTGNVISDEQIPKIHAILKKQMENIVLIGMPGCGKSSVGKMLAQRLNRTFVDADTAITEKAGISIPQIFENSGESGFRTLETQVLAELGKQSSLVIATGGGCVTRNENYPNLHQNGHIYWLKRSIDKLPTDGRPLSQAGNLEKMYAVRKPLYERFADTVIDNNADMEATLKQMLNLEEKQ